ncbi:MAG: CHAD domain-containing protein [Alphaproteobacteria bacterium]
MGADTAGTANAEREIALALGAVDPARIASHPLVKALAIGRAASRRLVSTYYDTADRDLIGADVVLRVRSARGRHVQTLKAGDPKGAGLAARAEWETALDGPDPIWPTAAPDSFDGRLGKALSRPIRAVFVTDFTRATRRLATPDGAVVELAIDTGEIRAGDAACPVAEVELELISGPPAALFDLAAGLSADLPLTLQTASKGERGYQLADRRRNPPVLGSRPALRPDMSIADAFEAIAPAAAGQAVSNTPAILDGDDPVEGVHQMRVGLRRLRAALEVFAPHLAKPDSRRIRALLRPTLRLLGPVRDLDVFADETLPPVQAAFPGDRALAAFARLTGKVRGSEARTLADHLADPAYTRAWLAVGRWLASAPVAADGPATAFATRVLGRHARRVARAGRRIDDGPLEALHALRIELKHLRYAAEFFAALFDEKAVDRQLRAVKKTQDILGHLNDLAVADAAIARIEAGAAADSARETARGAGMVRGWLGAQQPARRADARKAYHAFAEVAPFWA